MAHNPFKFLDSFEKNDKDRFFGRNKETAQLYNAVHASNLVLLYGGSGTGKTSLVMCGLANQFHDTDWLPVFIRREDDLNASIRRELLHQLPRNYNFSGGIRALVSEVYLEHYRPVYLIFDQFEELYISGDKTEQDTFHQTLSDLLKASLQCKILVVLREEYIAYLSEFEKAVPPLFDNRLRIEKMNDRNLARVITGTARYGNIHLDEPRKTVPAVLENLRDKREGVDLTNLQVYMDRLWRKDAERQGAKTDAQFESIEQIKFDPALIDSVGPMQNVLSQFLEEQLKGMENRLRERGVAKPQGIPLEILFTLVTEDGTKRNMTYENILKNLPRNRQITTEQLDYCLDEFQKIKLLRRFAEE